MFGMRKNITFLLSVAVVCIFTFPVYTLLAIDEVYSNVYYDALFGNIFFSMILIWGGRWSLVFGTMIVFQRIFEILTVQIWGNGTFSAGITRKAFIHFVESSSKEVWGYVQLLYPYLIIGIVVVIVYMFVYAMASFKIVRVLEHRRIGQALWMRILRLGFVFVLIYVGWNNRVRTDIFFFERNNDVILQLLTSDNTYPYMSEPVPEKDKIDFYFIVGESASSDYMSLYGYDKKTTPYLDSLPASKLSVFKNALSPASSTFSSYEIMFSRIKQSNRETFFLSPNLVEELKHMGYYTVWQSYHPARRSFVYESLLNSVDAVYSSNDNEDDRTMLLQLKDNMRDAPTAYFINMFGSHPYYDVPEDQKVFSAVAVSDEKQDTINRYNDTILALDDFIKRTVQLAEKHKEKTGRDYVVWYVSDHGQSLYNNGSDWVGHSTDSADTSGLRIPFFIVNKNNLPCGFALPVQRGINTGATFDMVIKSLCGVRSNK